MSFYYKLNEDAGDRHFIGVKTYENGVLESDEPLNSPYVTEVQIEQPTEQTPVADTVPTEQVAAPEPVSTPAPEQQPSGELN